MFPFFLLLYCYWKMYFLCIANYFARNKVYLLTLWTARQRMYCFQTASNWEISVHIAGCPLKKLKKRLISYCHKFMVSDSFTSEIPDFRYMQILSGGRLTVLSVDLPNYDLILVKNLHAVFMTVSSRYLQITQSQTLTLTTKEKYLLI